MFYINVQKLKLSKVRANFVGLKCYSYSACIWVCRSSTIGVALEEGWKFAWAWLRLLPDVHVGGRSACSGNNSLAVVVGGACGRKTFFL